MKVTKRPVFTLLLFSSLILLIFLIMQPWAIYQYKDYIAVLFPKGIIALEERNLLFLIQIIMLFIIIPVYILTFIFSWKYSAQNPKGKYDPDLVDSKIAEYIWWGVPCLATLFIAWITWIKTHELDPFKPLQAKNPPMTIQVVALQWKWLFIYPEEQIASVNFVQFPKETPIRFEITADAPMNSFWIPHLGGQIYAMPSMKTELNLIAGSVGDFRGSSANISGEGFAGMYFTTRASTKDEYKQWIKEAKQSVKVLNQDTYANLAVPSQYNPVEIFRLQEQNIFEQIIHKYMYPMKKE